MASERSRVVAGANILSALFMVGASGLLLALFALGLSVLHIFLVLSLLNAAAAVYVYQLLPEFLFRFVCWILTNCLYRLRTAGQREHPDGGTGAAGLQSRQLRRLDDHRQCVQAAAAVRHVPRLFQAAVDRLAVPRRQGDPDRPGARGGAK